jgi:hypothetical protein
VTTNERRDTFSVFSLIPAFAKREAIIEPIVVSESNEQRDLEKRGRGQPGGGAESRSIEEQTGTEDELAQNLSAVPDKRGSPREDGMSKRTLNRGDGPSGSKRTINRGGGPSET